MKQSHWLEFIQDTGDCIGGLLVGYAIAKDDVLTGIVGISCIFASLFLKHYYKPKT